VFLFYVVEDVTIAVAHEHVGKAVHSLIRRAGNTENRGAAEPACGERLFELRSPRAGRLSADVTYVATPLELRALAGLLGRGGQDGPLRVLSSGTAPEICARLGMGRRLGYIRTMDESFIPLEVQLAEFDRARPLRLAIINIFSAALGDSVQCLTLLREIRARLEAHFPQLKLDLLQARFSTATDALYLRSGLAEATYCLPLPVSWLSRYDAYFDFSTEYVRPDRAWIDGCLEAAGIDPFEVPEARKRNSLSLDPAAVARLAPCVEAARARGRPLLLIHPLASTRIRSIPLARLPSLIAAVLEHTDYTLVSTVPLPLADERFVDWSAASETFEDFAYLISQVDAFISADTATYHVADAFDVPGVVLFTSIEPAHRTPYYLFAEGLQLRPGNRLSGMHFSERPEDVTYAESLWVDLSDHDVIEALGSAVRKRAARGRRGIVSAGRTT